MNSNALKSTKLILLLIKKILFSKLNFIHGIEAISNCKHCRGKLKSTYFASKSGSSKAGE